MIIKSSIIKRLIWPKLKIHIPVIVYDVFEEDSKGNKSVKLNKDSFKNRMAARLFVAKINRQQFVDERTVRIKNAE